MHYALFINSENDIKLFPEAEEHTFTVEQIEQHLSQNNDVIRWVIYDHMPTEDDVDDFENANDEESDDE